MKELQGLVKFETEEGDLSISRDILREMENFMGIDLKNWQEDKSKSSVIKKTTKMMVRRFSFNPLWKELIELNAQRFGLDRQIAILLAHGDCNKEKWTYFDGDKSRHVQRWVNENDGLYSCLILDCCNPGRKSIHSKKSAVIAPTDIYSMGLHDLGYVNLEIYVPEIGYVSDYVLHYVLQDEIKRMKEMLERRR